MVMPVSLPKKCFISHAYADAAARDQIIRQIPSNVEAVVFPPITVKPEQFVSDRLISSLLDCECLIYLKGGKSALSFWVAFERDYALRAGKQVFAADPMTHSLVPDNDTPLDLAAFASYHHDDAPRVREIAEYLNRERYFDLWLDFSDLKAGDDWQRELSESLIDRLKRGGYVIVFWSQRASEALWVKREVEMAAEGISNFNDRVLFALLEDCQVPELWRHYQESFVQLYGDSKRSAEHRLDDLIVRLYWLIYKKTKIAT
jgi:hypothetical protein